MGRPIASGLRNPTAHRPYRAGSPESIARGHLFRQGKASISEELAGIFERLGLSAQSWQHGMEKLRGDRLVGRFFAASRAKLREIADRIGVRHVINRTGCPVR
jgi:hypothetical protein